MFGRKKGTTETMPGKKEGKKKEKEQKRCCPVSKM